MLVVGLGTSGLAIGVIEGVAESMALIVKVFSGTLSDYLGRRKTLAAIGYGGLMALLLLAGVPVITQLPLVGPALGLFVAVHEVEVELVDAGLVQLDQPGLLRIGHQRRDGHLEHQLPGLARVELALAHIRVGPGAGTDRFAR